VDSIEVSTVVYLPPEEVYEFLLDFPRYAEYSQHLREVRRHGDGGPGTNYHITFAWWRLSYTAVSRVTDVDPSNRIDWTIVEDIDARGYWQIDAEPDAASGDTDHASRVRLFVEFEPESADERLLDLPRFVSLDWLIDRVKPKVKREAERIVERIVADLEGESREVALTIHTSLDSI
jgi:uncharacterized membrane protein